MKKFETIFITICLFALIAVTGVVVWSYVDAPGQGGSYKFPETKYGAFLAAQHAIYVNDFKSAASFADVVKDVDYPVVQNTRLISSFLAGDLPSEAEILKNEKGIASQLIYSAHLIQNDDWKQMYNRHKTDDFAIVAPLRIWSGVANKMYTSTFEFIEKLPTNSSWKSFVRGQVYAEKGDLENAKKNFLSVSTDFMNLNDFLYLMSFYTHHDMAQQAEKLHRDFTRRPGGVFLSDDYIIPDWSTYSGCKNSLAFGLLQNVSHLQIMMYSDLSVLLMRFAQLIAPEYTNNNDAIHYYLGLYFYNGTGDYMQHFSKISKSSPFYLFASLRIIDKTNDIEWLKDIVDAHPLFVPGVNKLVGYYIQHGHKRAALRVIDNALSQDALDGAGRAFFTKSRAQIYYVFGDLESAQHDIRAASDVLVADSEILSLQAKIWAAQNREIENAYDYAMALVAQNPSDVFAWDTLGYVVSVREGVDAALEIFERVADVSDTCSSLFMHLGDMYSLRGDVDKARAAYIRAINLSGDGLTVIPIVERKIKDLR